MATLPQVVEAAHRIRKIQEHPDWQVLENEVKRQIDGARQFLLNGYAKSMEDYYSRSGWIQGAEFVLYTADRLDEKAARMREEQE